LKARAYDLSSKHPKIKSKKRKKREERKAQCEPNSSQEETEFKQLMTEHNCMISDFA